MLGKPNLSWATIFSRLCTTAPSQQKERLARWRSWRWREFPSQMRSWEQERPISPWMLLRDLRSKHQVRFGFILMYSLHIYESFVGSPKKGIVCAELQWIQKAASQWFKLCFLPMAPRWGGLGYVDVVGICWSRSCKLCLSSESFEQYVSICRFGIPLGSWGRSTIQKPSENRFTRAKTAKLALCLILCRFRVLAQMASFLLSWPDKWDWSQANDQVAALSK